MATDVRSTRQVADRLVELAREGRYVEAIRELYADEVTQCENDEALPARGREALAELCQGWIASRELHGTEVLGAHVDADSFVLELRYDTTPHETGKRYQWAEAACYRVRDGKIHDVRFYYRPA